MVDKFDIIDYLSGLTGFVFDKAVLNRIAWERGVDSVTSYEDLDSKIKDLLRADLLYVAYLSPNTWASHTSQHSSFSQTIGSQTITTTDRERLYNTFIAIYKKYDDAMLEQIETEQGNLQWL